LWQLILYREANFPPRTLKIHSCAALPQPKKPAPGEGQVDALSLSRLCQVMDIIETAMWITTCIADTSKLLFIAVLLLSESDICNSWFVLHI
jgi:hypothetical protein